jgi:uncharacterized membrane protein
LTFGERVADRVASFGGSWTFLGVFSAFMLGWMFLNTQAQRPMDPYPFILLNLILSCLAAVQAPVIMMSQNRQVAKDRFEAQLDYQVNLRAEMQIGALHLKLAEARVGLAGNRGDAAATVGSAREDRTRSRQSEHVRGVRALVTRSVHTHLLGKFDGARRVWREWWHLNCSSSPERGLSSFDEDNAGTIAGTKCLVIARRFPNNHQLEASSFWTTCFAVQRMSFSRKIMT